VGNARTALFNYLHSKHVDGQLVLRIEDTDLERSKKEYEENLIKDLKWMGIVWDEGPDRGGDKGPYRQSERTAMYREHAQSLIDSGKAYYCFCTPEELEKQKEEAVAEGRPPGYSGKCRSIPIEEARGRVDSGEEAAIRFAIPADVSVVFQDLVRGEVTFDSNLLHDLVIVRSNGMPAYNFSVVLDDHFMNIDLVVRGEDHLSNTARQVLFYHAFDFVLPKFAHLSMVMGADNTKLSKRHGSTSIAQFREQGYLPQALLNYLALLGWSPGDETEVMDVAELAKKFNLEKVSKSAAIFDYQKLKWMNREHIRLLDKVQLGRELTPFLRQAGYTVEESDRQLAWIGKTGSVLSSYTYLFTEMVEEFKQFTSIDLPEEMVKELRESESAFTVISRLYEAISTMESPVSFQDIVKITKEIQKDTGIKGKQLYHPIRLALTGKESGIELSDFIPIIEEGSMLPLTPAVQNMKSRLKTIVT
jgi:glutamyl-tRNA synthetase